MNDRLEYLLATKPFGELNAEERFFVTENISETEYEQLHFLLKNARPILQDAPAPNSAIRDNLLAAMRQMNAAKTATIQGGAIMRLLRTRVPAWQAAAGILVLLGLHFFTQKESPATVRTVTEYVRTTDTVYKEVAQPTMPPPTQKPNKRINVKPAEMPRPVPAIAQIADTSASLQMPPDSFSLFVSQPRGQSARQTADLWQFLGEVH